MPRHEGLGIESMGKSEFFSRLENRAFEKRIPVKATIELTYGCNLRCVHCYNPTHKAKGELSTQEFYRIIDELAQEGCFLITFTGGEMFTRRDTFEILTYAKKKGFVIVLFTNATLITPERADRIQALQPLRVEISIYGATPETYERVTGIPGSFGRFLEGVERLRERKVPLLIKMPAMTLNQHEVKQAKALVEGWGIRFIYCSEITPRQDGSLEPLRYRISPQEVIQLDQEILGEWQGVGQEEEKCQASEGLFRCGCGKSSVAVTPYGEMNLCINFPVPQYDLRTGSVSSGWKALVEYIDSVGPSQAYECPSCDVRDYCRQGPVDAWLERGDFSPCLPYFKELASLEKQTYETKDSRQHSGCNGDGEKSKCGP
ncbi:MAG: radical SAM protein [Acidobacteria bacterium]|nr:radical SAM protein [Acidobacteriota bacterium]